MNRKRDFVKLHSFALTVITLVFFVIIAITCLTACGATVCEVEPEIIYMTEYVEVPVEVPKDNAFYKHINLTDSDKHLLACILQLEAGNQSITGQRAVVEVIFNRMLDDRFPDTLTDVIYAKNQFSTVKALHKAAPTDTQYAVIEMVLQESVPVLPENIVYFATTPANGTFYERIGGHCFCY